MTDTEYRKRYEDFYISHLRKVEFYAYNYLGDFEMARSVAHDSFLTLWEHKEDVDFTKEVLPYLFSITRNKCLNLLRRVKTRNTYCNELSYRENALNQEAVFHPTSLSLYKKEVSGIIQHCLERMPPKVKETFLCSKVKGLKNREIAVALNVGETTVEYRLSCAYKILRKQLKDYLPFFLWFLLPIGLVYIGKFIK
ncbi:MAG: RNA polymerase sigma-70 factor [Bacteroidales bacterium]